MVDWDSSSYPDARCLYPQHSHHIFSHCDSDVPYMLMSFTSKKQPLLVSLVWLVLLLWWWWWSSQTADCKIDSTFHATHDFGSWQKLKNAAVYHPGNTITSPHPRYVWVDDLPTFPFWWDICDPSWTALYHFFPTVVSGVIFFTRRQGKGVALQKLNWRTCWLVPSSRRRLLPASDLKTNPQWIGWRAFER